MLKYFLPAVALVSLISCDQQEDSVFPVETAITEAVYASVTVQPDSLYQAFAVVNGLLDENLVEEGDVVQKGDVLVQIIKTNPELASKNAFLALQLARENFEGGAASLRAWRKKLKRQNFSF